jgi:hypothetical protein
MNKKIFDILPPGLSKENSIKKVSTPEKADRSYLAWWGFLIFGILIVGFFYQLWGTRFVLYLEPATRIITTEAEIKIQGDVSEIDFQGQIIPGRIVTGSQDKSQIFKATGEGREDISAKGIIRVYNAINPPQSLNLRATTRFLTGNGVYFRAPEAIYLPAGKIENGRLVPSEVDVPVEAMDPGPNSNIGPTKFSIPGLLGTELYDKVYGESLAPMTGGSSTRFIAITQSDLRGAEEALNLVLINDLIEQVENDNPNIIVLSEAISIETIEKSFSHSVGERVDDFSCQMEMKGSALAFQKDDLNQILKSIIKGEFGSDYLIVPESLYLDYRVLSFDIDQEFLRINLKFSAEIYHDLSEEKWMEEFCGLTRRELKDKLLKDQRLSAFQFKIAPFWLRRIPSLDKIKVELLFKR